MDVGSESMDVLTVTRNKRSLFRRKFYNLKMNDEEFENFTKLARIPKMSFVFQPCRL
jgi:hypothetical protein